MIIQHLIPLISSYFSGGFSGYWFFPLLALAFLCTVPCILKLWLR